MYKRKIHLFIVAMLTAVGVSAVAIFYSEIFAMANKIARLRFLQTPHILFITVPCIFLISSYLCRRFAPNAAGSGPEHVISALKKLSNDEKKGEGVEEYLSLKVLFTNMASSLLCAFGGGALGREGPLVQISASIFLMIGQRTKLYFPGLDIRSWIIAGSAAGFAAAFNAPIAGIIFAIEELYLFHLDRKFSAFKTNTFFAVVIAGVMCQFITGSYVLFEFPQMTFLWGTNFAVILLIALSCGVFAWILKKSIRFSTELRRYTHAKIWYLFPILGGLLVASISVLIGPYSFGSGVQTIQDSLLSSKTLLTSEDFVGRFLNIFASAAAGCAGGLLLPALALGAGIGSIGSLLLPMEDARIFITTGMAAFLGGLFNIPLTAAILVLEITDQRELIIQLFMSTLISAWVYQMLDESVEELFRKKHHPSHHK